MLVKTAIDPQLRYLYLILYNILSNNGLHHLKFKAIDACGGPH